MTADPAIGDVAADPRIGRLLELARVHLGMDVAWLSTFSAGRQVIEAAQGATAAMNVHIGAGSELSGSFCARVLAGTLPPVITDARRHLTTRELAVTRELVIGSYVGAPWRDATGRIAGMLCCVSRSPKPGLDEHAVRFVTVMAELVGDHLASPEGRRMEAKRRLTAVIHHVLDTQAITIVFQPIVRIADSAVVAGEALTRFDPALFATPDRGFAAAADCDLGVSMELLAAQCALAQRERVPEQWWLNINLSADAARTGQAQQLLLSHCDQRVGIEITEHTPITDYDQLNADLAPLRAAGIRLTVDDAGAGYASLNHILRLRPDTIKLDISLVRGIEGDPVRRALTRSLVDFAGEIGADLLAEGVETTAERDVLHHLGVGYGQGFLWGRPAPLAHP